MWGPTAADLLADGPETAVMSSARGWRFVLLQLGLNTPPASVNLSSKGPYAGDWCTPYWSWVTARTGSTQLGLHKPPVLSVPGPWWFNQSTGCQHSPHPPHIHCQHSFAMQGTTREREVSSRAPVLRPAKIFTPPLLHENLTTTILATFNVYLYNPIIYLIRLFFNFFNINIANRIPSSYFLLLTFNTCNIQLPVHKIIPCFSHLRLYTYTFIIM